MNDSILEKTEKRIESERRAYLESYTKIIESLILSTSVIFVFLSVTPNVTNKTPFWVAVVCLFIVLISSLLSLFHVKDLHYGEMLENTVIRVSLQVPKKFDKSEDLKQIQETLKRMKERLQKEELSKEETAERFLWFAFVMFITGLLMVLLSFI